MEQYSDIQLVNLIRQGDIKSFERVFNTYCENLVRYAESILKNTYEAEDIVQQLFVQCWAKRETLDVNTSLKSYLYKSTYNSCLNKIKQLGVRESYAAYHLHVNQGQAGAASQQLEAKEAASAIQEAMNELPEQCRLVFKMSRFDQMKYQEIADELGISIKTVENQMGKALKHMRLKLKDYIMVLLLFFIH